MVKVGGSIDEHLIDGVHHDVLWSDVLQIDAIDLPRHFLIVCHPRWSHQIGHLKGRVSGEGSRIIGWRGQRWDTILIHSGLVPNGISQTTVVDLFDTLHDLEQSSSTRNAV